MNILYGCLLLACAVCVVLSGVAITVPEQHGNLERQQSTPAEIHLPVGDHDHHDHNDDNNNSDDSSFCHGMSMTMFVDGFEWSLLFRQLKTNDSSSEDHDKKSATDDDAPSCLSYYVSSWKLNGADKFRGAMVFTFILAFLSEGLSSARLRLIPHLQYLDTRRRKLVLTISYGLQQWLGTMIMLVSMTYSMELLASVVAGLMVGNFFFYRSDHTQNNLTLCGNRPTPRGPAPLPHRNSPFYNPPRSTSGRSSITAAISRRLSAAAASSSGSDSEERQSLLLGGGASPPSPGHEDNTTGLQLQMRKED